MSTYGKSLFENLEEPSLKEMKKQEKKIDWMAVLSQSNQTKSDF